MGQRAPNQLAVPNSFTPGPVRSRSSLEPYLYHPSSLCAPSRLSKGASVEPQRQLHPHPYFLLQQELARSCIAPPSPPVPVPAPPPPSSYNRTTLRNRTPQPTNHSTASHYATHRRTMAIQPRAGGSMDVFASAPTSPNMSFRNSIIKGSPNMQAALELQPVATAPASAPPAPPPTDSLHLPLPPTSLVFGLRSDESEIQLIEGVQRYVRKGTPADATSAVIGKGGFGTAYRYERDESFTPPTSLEPSPISRRSSLARDDTSPYGSQEQAEQLQQSGQALREREPVESLADFGVHEEAQHTMRRQTSARSLSSLANHRAREAAVAASGTYPSRSRCVSTASRRSVNSSSDAPQAAAGSSPTRPPSVIVVKVCRTPTSGSFDELPRTGVGRAEAKAAEVLLASGGPIDPRHTHTRIVRGELRLLRFLQAAAAAEGLNQRDNHVVRLIADVSLQSACEMANMVDGNLTSAAPAEEPQSGSPPTPRLLVFERLIDLDAILTGRGWMKRPKDGLWSVDEVESMARDVAAGLKFLHAHCVVHGDLKPANLMRCAKTGIVKIIDLGASRRWVRLPVTQKESSTAVEELDQRIKSGELQVKDYAVDTCEGLGSLTGSPHFMAPEVLLQAGRYLSADGYARGVLDDYRNSPSYIPQVPNTFCFDIAHSEFKRGWGRPSDIWSWGCSVLAMLLRTLPADQRPRSSSVCPFDFGSFEEMDDALEPLFPVHKSEDSLPRFHLWARLFPLRICETVESGLVLPPWARSVSPQLYEMLRQAFSLQDRRPTASLICKHLARPPHLALEQLSLQRGMDTSSMQSGVPSPSSSCFGSISLAGSTTNLNAPSISGHSAASSAFARQPLLFQGHEAPLASAPAATTAPKPELMHRHSRVLDALADDAVSTFMRQQQLSPARSSFSNAAQSPHSDRRMSSYSNFPPAISTSFHHDAHLQGRYTPSPVPMQHSPQHDGCLSPIGGDATHSARRTTSGLLNKLGRNLWPSSKRAQLSSDQETTRSEAPLKKPSLRNLRRKTNVFGSSSAAASGRKGDEAGRATPPAVPPMPASLRATSPLPQHASTASPQSPHGEFCMRCVVGHMEEAASSMAHTCVRSSISHASMRGVSPAPSLANMSKASRSTGGKSSRPRSMTLPQQIAAKLANRDETVPEMPWSPNQSEHSAPCESSIESPPCSGAGSGSGSARPSVKERANWRRRLTITSKPKISQQV